MFLPLTSKPCPLPPNTFWRSCFTAFFRIGHIYYYHKEQLEALNDELKKRNVNLEHLQSLLQTEKAFKQLYQKLKEQVCTRKTKKSFIVQDWLRDIASEPIKLPDRSLVQADLDQTQQEFAANGYSGYIDIHKGTHAMVKYISPYERYLEAGLRRKMSDWCDRFNARVNSWSCLSSSRMISRIRV